MTNEQPESEKTHTGSMLQVEKDALIGEELKLISVEKTKVMRDGQEVELYIYFAKRMSDEVVVSFFGASVLNSQYDLGYLKPNAFFVLDKFTSKASNNTYFKSIILHKEVSK
jgi:hypothetical protein